MTDNVVLDPLDRMRLSLAEAVKDLMECKNENEKDIIHERIKGLTDQIVNTAKQGDAPVFIVNLTEKRWLVNRSYSSFWIRGKDASDEYSVTEITGRRGKVDTGRGGDPTPDRGWHVKLDPLYWRAEQVAKDVCREINGDLPPIEMRSPSHLQKERTIKTMGVFVSPTRVPPPELLETEVLALRTYDAALVAEGNKIWRKTHDYRLISDLARDAVDRLGLSTDWHESVHAIMQQVERPKRAASGR